MPKIRKLTDTKVFNHKRYQLEYCFRLGIPAGKKLVEILDRGLYDAKVVRGTYGKGTAKESGFGIYTRWRLKK
jgi:hypothetical protein